MKMLELNCDQCKRIFKRTESSVKLNEKRGKFNIFCSLKCSCIFNKGVNRKLKSLREIEYLKHPKLCINCNLPISYNTKNKNKYCGHSCASIYSQKSGGNHKWTISERNSLSDKMTKILTDYHSLNKKEKILKICPNCNKNFLVVKSQSNRISCSRKCSVKWINDTGYYKNKGRGGYRSNSGTSKKGWYKGIFCGSSWELAWVIFNIDHNIKFSRNVEGFKYTFNGKHKKYYPDFILNDENIYIEIKNYHTDQVEAKSKQFPHKLNILYKKDLESIFEYVKKTYGNNYICLYDTKTSGRSPM